MEFFHKLNLITKTKAKSFSSLFRLSSNQFFYRIGRIYFTKTNCYKQEHCKIVHIKIPEMSIMVGYNPYIQSVVKLI